jgi:NAD(P)-dependent dehydrogenase (short-subunit alcohol dehydrogenase family)
VGEEKERFDDVVKVSMNNRRPGLTDEIAGTIDMLYSVEAGWTTGSVVCANRGMRMSTV